MLKSQIKTGKFNKQRVPSINPVVTRTGVDNWSRLGRQRAAGLLSEQERDHPIGEKEALGREKNIQTEVVVIKHETTRCNAPARTDAVQGFLLGVGSDITTSRLCPTRRPYCSAISTCVHCSRNELSPTVFPLQYLSSSGSMDPSVIRCSHFNPTSLKKEH